MRERENRGRERDRETEREEGERERERMNGNSREFERHCVLPTTSPWHHRETGLGARLRQGKSILL